MVATIEEGNDPTAFQFGNVRPSPAAHAELWWHFNEAEEATSASSNFATSLFGARTTTVDETERRVEAGLAKAKIEKRLGAVRPEDAYMLMSLYTERAWPAPVEQVLGVLTGVVVVLPIVCAEHFGAATRSRTGARTLTAWLEERIARGGAEAVAVYAREAQMACARAVRAYDRVRGKGPSVVPPADGDEG
ncbi:MAG TPA: hypothetical protein VGG39_38245 [Polyangiaceae bacterium]|jgi:hypothetical protein